MTKPPPYNLDEVERRLTEASSEHEGVRYVRASVALNILGVGPGLQTRWQRSGKITARRFAVPRSSKAPRGVLTAWTLDQVIAVARTYRSQRQRNWTAAEDAEVEDLLGRYSAAAIGRRLGRTAVAIRRRAIQLGVTPRNADGLLTTGDVARLCGVSVQGVAYWLAHGLPHRVVKHSRNVRLTHPADLLTYVRSMPTWDRLTPLQRGRLETMGRDRHGAKGRAA